MVFKMKRLIVSLVLVLMLVSGIGLLSACKDKGYALENLSKDYSASTDNLNYVKIVDNNIKIDFKGGNENKNYLNATVSSIEPYSILKKCEQILKNELIFVEHYVKICSNEDIDAPASERDSLKSNLDNFKSSLNDLNSALASLDETVEVYYHENKQTNLACLSRLKAAMSAFNNAFLSAGNFSDSLINLYFNRTIKDANKNFLNVDIDNFNSAEVINTLDSKIYFEVTNLTKVFIEKHFSGNTNYEKFVSGGIGTFNTEYIYYNSKISDLKTNYDVDSAIVKVNGTNKANFYNLTIENYNAFELMNNQLSNFESAKNAIEYCDINEESSSVDLANKLTIDDFENLTENYRQVLVNMLTLMKGE